MTEMSHNYNNFYYSLMQQIESIILIPCELESNKSSLSRLQLEDLIMHVLWVPA